MSGPSRSSAPSAGSSAASVAIAQPWVASASEQAGQVVARGGSLYTVPATRTAAGTFSASNYTLGAAGEVYEQNGSGQVVAVWKGNGTGVAATKILDVLTSGAVTGLGAWSAGTAYGVNAIVTRPLAGGTASFLAVAATTGVDPATDDGSHWMLLAQGATGNTGATGSPTTDQSILLRHLADLARDFTLLSGHVVQSMDRRAATSNIALTSGTLQFSAIAVPGGRTINNISLCSGNIGATSPTHQWFCLYDASRNKLAVTVDDTTTAWASSAVKTLALSAPYTPSAGSFLYVGVLITATTPNNVVGMGQANPAGNAPNLAGSSTAALTDPASAPATAAAFVGKAPFWASLS